MARIKGKIIDFELMFDETMQENILVSSMKMFGLSDSTIGQAKNEILKQREALEEKHFFSE